VTDYTYRTYIDSNGETKNPFINERVYVSFCRNLTCGRRVYILAEERREQRRDNRSPRYCKRCLGVAAADIGSTRTGTLRPVSG